MALASLWPYKLYTLLIVGKIGGAERRGSRVFMHIPTTARHLGFSSKRLQQYLLDGQDLALFTNIKKRYKIWSFDIALPTDGGRDND
jgi:hypothetical protein